MDQTAITASINNQNTFKHSVAANLRYFRELNHTRFDRNVILTSVFKTTEYPLETCKIELNVSIFLSVYKSHYYPHILSIFIITPPFQNMDDFGKSVCEIMSSIVTVIKRKKIESRRQLVTFKMAVDFFSRQFNVKLTCSISGFLCVKFRNQLRFSYQWAQSKHFKRILTIFVSLSTRFARAKS